MKYWKCLEENGIVYSSCGLVNICCLFGKKNLDKDELFPFLKVTSSLIKKKLPNSIIKKKPKKILRSNDLDDILSNQLTNQSRSSRRKPSTNKKQNSLFCGKQGDKGELYHWHVSLFPYSITNFF